jgi:5-methyltetrahydrofolate--homocysteine methyltransferase
MIIVGERINGTSHRVRDAIVARDSDFIAEQAVLQADVGAHYIDANAGTGPDREVEDMAWLVETIQDAADRPVCVDSASAGALKAGLEVHQGQALLNSATAEESRQQPVLELAQAHGARLIALTLDDSGLPKTGADRVAIAKRLSQAAEDMGIGRQDLFIDPLARSIGVENDQGIAFLEAVAGIREALPGIHIICGLSNISYQMPSRKLLNRTFLAMAIAKGLDAAIFDPLDQSLMAVICAAQALLGRDEMCMEYIRAHRAGRLEQ